MKRIIFSTIVALCAMLQNANAQEYVDDTIYQHGINEIKSVLPATVTITNATDGKIEVSIPESVKEFVSVHCKNKVLYIERRDNSVTPKQLAPLNEMCRIYVTVASSDITSIWNTSDMSITFADEHCARFLRIFNTSGMFVHGDKVTAEEHIELYNTGTMTSDVKMWNTDFFVMCNTGFMYTHGATSARHIQQNSTNIENTQLRVECLKLEINSTGTGVIEYIGTADEVNVNSTGDASISTSELNNE